MMPYLFYQKQRIHNLATTCKPFEYKIEYLAFPISNQTEKFDKHVISCSASNKASHKYNNYKTVSVTITTSAAHFPLFSIYLQSNLEHSSILCGKANKRVTFTLLLLQGRRRLYLTPIANYSYYSSHVSYVAYCRQEIFHYILSFYLRMD